MADVADSSSNESPRGSDRSTQGSVSPALEYQKALERYEAARLHELQRALALTEPGGRSRALAARIAERLGEPRVGERLLAGLDAGPRLAISLFALTETTSWSLTGLRHALACLGLDPTSVIIPLLDLGFLALRPPEDQPARDFASLIGENAPKGVQLLVHPAASGASRTVLPEEPLPSISGPVRQVRESDGLEPVLRLGAVWQRVVDAPLRRTQQGTLYKRDRDRLEEDPVLAGPIADALEPLPDMAALWIALARGVGLLVDDPDGDRIVAARPSHWAENAIHLPHMIAVRWLGLRNWHEQGGMQQEGIEVELALPYVRPAVLLWLATVPEEDWVAIDELEARLRASASNWDRTTFLEEPPAPSGRVRAPRGKKETRTAPGGRGDGVLESLLLGASYQLGLVRAAEDATTGKRVVQLSPLGRYILALGPPPPPRPVFEHFLFVQPNFEIVAYRQGLTPALIGHFSRFARWSQVGAALELRLTPESVYGGLEGGLAPSEMLDRLTRHSSRPLPAGIAEALRTWAGRRERVTYYASATLIEFATRADLEQALAQWPETGRVAPIAISDRLLLVEDESAIPFQRFRMTGARDYRRAPESCLEVEADGVTLTLDLARSDLLVDAELTRFTDEQPMEPAKAPGNPRRRFRVSSSSLARGVRNGLTPALLAHWYQRRTGAEVPPSVRLLMRATGTRVPPLATSRPLLLHTPSAELLDGLVQHPETQIYLDERLGPTSVVIREEALESFQRVLHKLGLAIADPPPALGERKPEESPDPSLRVRRS